MKINKLLLIKLVIIILLSISCNKEEVNRKQENNFVTDIAGNTYKTVTIGNQIWMAENLKVTKYNDGSIIPNITERNNWAYATIEVDALCTY